MKYFYFLLLFFSINCFSNESFQSFILTKTGSQIVIKANFFRVDYAEKTVFYKLLNSDAENKMSFKDFDYVIIGKYKFKTLKLNNSKEFSGFFVLAESSSKSLILSTASDEDNENVVHYFFYIVDSNNIVVESLQFDNIKKPKSASVRGDIFTKIQFYFNDCKLLMDRISSFDNTSFENLNMNILGFFDSPVYFECH